MKTTHLKTLLMAIETMSSLIIIGAAALHMVTWWRARKQRIHARDR